MTVKIENGNLVITIPANTNPPISKTGKSRIVATTGGFMASTAVVAGKPVKIGLNAIIAAD